MSIFNYRTDLACESDKLASASEKIEGVELKDFDVFSLSCQELAIESGDAAAAIGKAAGLYYTLSIDALLRREDDSFYNSVSALSELLSRLLRNFSIKSNILVVGLGNRSITPDAVGPVAASSILVTRHLKATMPKDFSGFAPVSVIVPGVLGTSGIESFDFIKNICELVKPSFVIAIDALAARGLERLCTTIQLTDSGISPGSGVGNSRPEISLSTLGIPVIAIGVPTVVDLRSIFSDLGTVIDENASANNSANMIVTPRSIDALITSVSRVIAYGLNMALHPGLTISDIDMLLC